MQHAHVHTLTRFCRAQSHASRMVLTSAAGLQPCRCYTFSSSSFHDGDGHRGIHTTARAAADSPVQYARAPRYGLSTIVSREHLAHPGRCAEPPSAPPECRVMYDDAGVPLAGPVRALPRGEQLRLLTALLAAAGITVAVYEGVKFELLYYGLWQRSFRRNASLSKRLQSFVSTAAVGCGLVCCYAFSFLFTSFVVGRVRLGSFLLSRASVHVLPQRVYMALARKTSKVFAF